MEKELESVVFEILPYKDSGTYIIKSFESAFHLVDDSLTTIQSKSASKKPCGEELVNWENKLSTTQNVLDEWLQCQTSWLYLYPIFNSKDIQEQCPVENKSFQAMDGIWRKIMKTARDNPQFISLCPDKQLLNSLRECNELSEEVQKGLNNYLATKRNSFPRFFFLSDDDVLEILSQQKDLAVVQKHIKKCFDNIAGLKIEEDLKITKMISGEGEEVDFTEALYPTGNVEDWLLEMERVMKRSLRKMIKESLIDYKQVPRTEWALKWPAQVAIAGCQTYWTQQVTKALEQNNLKECAEVVYKQIVDLRDLLQKEISKNARTTLTNLIILELGARDAVTRMVEENVNKVEDFQWVSQIRHYWSDENLIVRALNAEFAYGYEYHGNPLRLVITPLTDRCYLTLISAFHLKLGGCPHGPAGTGKTESAKDLAKIMGMQCVVLNCSDQLDYLAMGRFFQGIASTGAWACFDEFNRIDIEVLSVVGQQIAVLQKAQREKAEKFILEGVELTMKPSFAIIITMNPGYAGRTELPDNLKPLFRPVGMVIVDYSLISEVDLFLSGFSNAKVLAKKIKISFKLFSEQLSSQDHYDFGLRGIKKVLIVAGGLKRKYPDINEEVIVLKAIQDVNEPKFVTDDLKLYNGIISDLFPNTEKMPSNYGVLDKELRKACAELGVKDFPGFIQKCIQLFEITLVRHGVALVGPTASGKTKCYEALMKAQTALKGEMSPTGIPFETTHTNVLNPKAITMDELYGFSNPSTQEWTDGVLTKMLRLGSVASNEDKRWYVFDGPVDPFWVESMNTVLDDNKKLKLSSGEVIKITDRMTMMFEVENMSCATPAFVSRCGVVNFDTDYMGLDHFVECWLEKLPDCISDPHKKNIEKLFSVFMEPAIKLVRSHVKEIVPTVNANLVFSLLKLMDCFLAAFLPKEGERPFSQKELDRLVELMEPWFIFSLVWSVGATGDNNGRKTFSDWLRQKMKEEKVHLVFPEEGLVYDYKLDDGGISSLPEDSGKEVKREVCWKSWMSELPDFIISPEARFTDICVPTVDTIRSSYILDMLLTNNKTVLCVGPVGSGKTLTITEKLTRGIPEKYLPEFMSFSASTSANQTQDKIEGRIEKRYGRLYGPPTGKHMVFFIDDLNMPTMDKYATQPSLELLRQWMNCKGWYNRNSVGDFMYVEDVNFVCAMRPPNGARSHVSPRLLRHFNVLGFPEMEDSCKRKIFGTIFKSWTSQATKLDSCCDMVVSTCIEVYNSIQRHFQPTPAKCHYTFNLRDLSRVFQGMMMADPINTNSIEKLMKLWFHENCRVFQDCLVSDEDQIWLTDLLKAKIENVFNKKYEEVINLEPLIFGDFLDSNINKKYVEMTDNNKMVETVDKFLSDYNQINTEQMNLVLFMDAVKHVSRISRIIRQPFGNALLLGMGGSGRKSLTQLAAHMAGVECIQLDHTKWREDLRKVLMKAGLEDKSLVFLLSDTEMKNERCWDDINNILNFGDISGIYGKDDLDQICNVMKSVVQDAGLQPTETNLFLAYKKRVKNNLHTVIRMSPHTETLCERLRQFPALVNCCTIDWFSEWPEDALKSVASKYLNDIPELENKETVMKGLVDVCQEIHQSVTTYSGKFQEELPRHISVTPSSYLDFLNTFSNLLVKKKSELATRKSMLQTGIDKLGSFCVDLKNKWIEKLTAITLNKNIVGDVLISVAVVAYLGPFTGENRSRIYAEWIKILDANKVPRTSEQILINTLGDPLQIRSWQVAGLPKDNISVENVLIAQFSRKWPLFIDPQGQANKWIKNMERDNGLVIIKPSDEDFLRGLKKAVPFGRPCLLENVEEVNPVLESLLLKQTFRKQGSLMIKVGDTVIPYNENFKLYMTSKLPIISYSPHISTKVTVVNFTLTPSGLEDQLLDIILAEKRPDLEESKNRNIDNKELEDHILYRLSTVDGSLHDDHDVVASLEEWKKKSIELTVAKALAVKTARMVNEVRSEYLPVAVNAQILYFCIADMASIDPMYQYSQESFKDIFLKRIASPYKNLKDLNDDVTFALYSDVCKGLFEKHKMVFAFLLAARINMHKGLINMDEWKFLLVGGIKKCQNTPNPAPEWISEKSWNDFLTLSSIDKFSGFIEDFKKHLSVFKAIFESEEPHRKDLPGDWNKELNAFQKILVIKCLRPDKVIDAMKDYVSYNLGQRFIEPQTVDLASVYDDASPSVPVFFILSPGAEPASDLYDFASKMGFAKKLDTISLGQGQGKRAESMIRNAMEKGNWVFLQNCHLGPSWMPALEKILKQIKHKEVHKDFRLWLSGMSSTHFPPFILQNSIKMTIEPLSRVKASLLKSYSSFCDDFYNCGEKTPTFKKLLWSLCVFHGVIVESQKYSSSSFNILYEFANGDLRISIDQLKMFLQEYEEIPFKLLLHSIAEINYCGRIYDDWDRRCLMNIFKDYCNKDVLKENHVFTESGIYHQINTSLDQNGYMAYIHSLPNHDSPETFGLPGNSDIAFALSETRQMLNALEEIQLKTASVDEKSREKIIEETAETILQQIPLPIAMDSVFKKHPVLYDQPMNIVLTQEVIRYNTLLNIVHSSLQDLLKALKGRIVMTKELEIMASSLYKNAVPVIWSKKAYLSAKPLASWITDLVARMSFIKEWIDNGIPPMFWISSLFFPQGFLTGTLQNFARQKSISFEKLSFSFEIMKEDYKDIKKPPEDGCYIRGLSVKGARWDNTNFTLCESQPKELYTDMPVIWLKPMANKPAAENGLYVCPVYKTSSRTDITSTTGQSSNFLFAVELPTDKPPKHWIKRGVAMFCALD